MKRSPQLAVLHANIPAEVSCSTGPCAYGSPCCNWGTTLQEAEVNAIKARFPDHEKLIVMKHGEMRTRVRNGACVFKTDNSCSIHDEPFYPLVCRHFPWASSTGGPYSDVIDEYEICPDVVRVIASLC